MDGVAHGSDRKLGEERPPRIMNVNIGVLGHIDSGKTSLVRSLSTLLSTASLDKHPQSMERGITLDLGFSAFLTDVPAHLPSLPYDKVQFTLVDCPGHASLIRTIMGGAQIIDMMILVVDITKGIQTQTAECLVIGEISPCRDMIVALNKVDLLPEAARTQQAERMKKRLRATFQGTKFAGCDMVVVAARPGGPDGEAAGLQTLGMDDLMASMSRAIKDQPPMSTAKDNQLPFLFAIDHCFPIRGQGTVLTGTVLQGAVSVNQMIELPPLKLQRKVKSMQVFHRPVSSARQGDRVGLCVTQLDSKLLERGLAAAPGSVPMLSAAVASVRKIRFFKGRISSKGKLHITVGHSTVMADVMFFTGEGEGGTAGTGHHARGISPLPPEDGGCDFDLSRDYLYQDELAEDEKMGKPDKTGPTDQRTGASALHGSQRHWALLLYDSPIYCPIGSLLIGSRLDADIHVNQCRLAFHGNLVKAIDPEKKETLRVYKMKTKEGMIERFVDEHTVIGKGMFKKETDMSLFTVSLLSEYVRCSSVCDRQQGGGITRHTPLQSVKGGLFIDGQMGENAHLVGIP
ncbi:hypothetical protein CBR_g48935 [Chara braunii]|uniref:Selenocysteine-specific elongation factor n=1 Tax=Chara braunii TaxID=69332 RepID=A0A388M3R7_CHABU|nr:hypothetical protein CBR_g48935 [Chara braunii]|eukprot:GBG89227.1 hypothetical protein CBR_g48935 [Chara braunii]